MASRSMTVVHRCFVWIAVAFMGGGCMTRRADRWESDLPRAPEGTRITLLVIGNAAEPRPALQAGLDAFVRAELAAHRHPVVIDLGNASVRRRCPSGPDPEALGPTGPRLAALSPTGARPEALGPTGPRLEVRGAGEWSCAGPHSMGVHRAVSLMPKGDLHVDLRCDAQGCTRKALLEPPLLRFALLDLWPWIDPSEATEGTIQALHHFMEALETEDDGAPWILVSHAPVEAAGTHGVGGFTPDATFHMLPPVVQAAIEKGRFVGTIGGRDSATYAHPDIADAVMRADKRWLEASTFEIVSGATGRTGGPLRKRLRYGTSLAFMPDVYSPAPGFAVLYIAPDRSTLDVAVVERRVGRWRHAMQRVSLAPAERGRVRTLPPMAPCLRCLPVPPNARD